MKRLLTYPGTFQAQAVSIKDQRGANERISGRVDNNLLKSQEKVVRSVLEDKLSLAHFADAVSDLNNVATAHAQLRPGGVSQKEFKVLQGQIRSAGQEASETVSPQTLGLYEGLKSGTLEPDSVVTELNWQSQRAYGRALQERGGVTFRDERSKLRASQVSDAPKSENEKPEFFVHPELKTFVDESVRVFTKLDDDSNGLIDRREARKLLTSYQQMGLSPAVATTFYSRQLEIASLRDDAKPGDESVSLDELKKLSPENHPFRASQDFQRVVTRVSKRYDFESQRDSEESSPFIVGDDFRALNVHQGREGSCWLLSNLPAISNDTLAEIIKPDGENYRVSLADQRSTLVEPLNEVEKRIYSAGDGSWSGLLEKGVSQLFDLEGRDINGGLTSEARALLTGRNTQKHNLLRRNPDGPELRDPEVLARVLEQALEDGGAVFASAHPADYDQGISKISAAGHGYTVLSVNAEEHSISVRNAWGRGEKADTDGLNDGVFELSTLEFLANFSFLDIDPGTPA